MYGDKIFINGLVYVPEAVLVICDLAKMEKGEPTMAVDLPVKPLLQWDNRAAIFVRVSIR